MVLIRSYTPKRSDLKNFLILAISILCDRFQVLRFLPINVEITPAILFFLLSRKENFIPIWLIFIIGILNDFLSGSPIGESTLAFLVFYMLVSRYQALRTADLAAQWIFFGGCTVIFTVVLWVLACLQNQGLLSLWPGLQTYGITVGLYPLLFFIFNRFSKRENTL